MSIRIDVMQGNALVTPADVLALKFAQQLYGVDAAVASALGDRLDQDALPHVGETLLVGGAAATAAKEVLFVGVEPLGRFDYGSIRKFSRTVLETLKSDRPEAKHVLLTVHGVGFGLDAAEAFRAEVAGLFDAIVSGDYPSALSDVTIVERDVELATRLSELLTLLRPEGSIVPAPANTSNIDRPGLRVAAGGSLGQTIAALSQVGTESKNKPLVFVAMPFADEYADRYHYGIVGAANAAGFLCERADLATFTGDVVAWVKDRISNASLVIADLSAANPNVYLEVGYAWGRGVNTVLIVQKADELKFDVRGQRCLVFNSIRHLEELLTKELKQLALSKAMS